MPTPTPGWGGSFNPSQLPRGSNPSALTIDQVNRAMRASPLWNSWMSQHGKNPASVHLSDSDKNGLAKTLELAGFPLPDGWEVDDSGNLREETHKLRNTAIIAGVTVAAVFGGPAVYHALSGLSGTAPAAAGTTAATGAGVGIGETGAVTGLAGSGFGVTAGVGGGGAAAGWTAGNTLSAFRTGAELFGSLYGAHIQSDAAQRAADAQSGAARYSADLQARANAEALAFQKDAAENAFLNNEAARHGNYDQDAARQRRLGTIGEEVGLGPREIPDYVPGVDPHYGSSAATPGATGFNPGPAPAGSSALAGGGLTMPQGIDPRFAALYQKYGITPGARGSGPTDWQYYQNDAVRNAGGDVGYVLQRLESDLQKRPGGASTPSTAASAGGMFAPYTQPTPFQTSVQPAPIPGMFGGY